MRKKKEISADTSAIVHVPGKVSDDKSQADTEDKAQKKPEKDKLSPFAKLLLELKARQPDETTSNLGQVTWEGFPVEQVFADGLWAVAIGLAKQHRAKITSTMHVEDASTRIEYLVNAGLVIGYDKDIAKAADEFEKEVQQAIFETLQKKPQSEPVLAQSVWQLPAAKFFARLIKTARTTIEKILEEAEELLLLDVKEGISFSGRAYDIGRFQNQQQALNWSKLVAKEEGFLTGSQVRKYEVYRQQHALKMGEPPPEEGDTYPNYEECRTGLQELALIRGELAVLRKMPFRLNDIPDDLDIDVKNKEVGPAWIQTQLLLAALDLPDREHIEGEEHKEALQAAAKCDPETLIAKFWDRVHGRGAQFTPKDREAFKPCLLKNIQVLKDLSDPKSEWSKLNATMQFVRSKRGVLAKELRKEGVDKAFSDAKDISEANWKDMTLDGFKELLSLCNESPADLFTPGIWQMKPELQEGAVSHLMQYAEIDQKAIKAFDEAGLVRGNFNIFRRYWHLLSPAWLEKNFDSYIEETEACHYDLLALTMNRLDTSVVRRLLNTPKWRGVIAYHVGQMPLIPENLEPTDDEEAYKVFREKLGEELLTRYMLASVVSERELVFQNWQNEPEALVLPWQKNPESKDLDIRRSLANLQLGGEDLAALFRKRKYSERNSVQWLKEGQLDRDEDIAAYFKMRDQYFRDQKRLTKDKS